MKVYKELLPRYKAKKIGGLQLQVFFAVKECLSAKGWLNEKGELREAPNDRLSQAHADNVRLAKANDLLEEEANELRASNRKLKAAGKTANLLNAKLSARNLDLERENERLKDEVREQAFELKAKRRK